MSEATPAVVGSPSPAPAFDWRLTGTAEQRDALATIFRELVGDHPEFALGVHFDPTSAYLSMPEPPPSGVATGTSENTNEEWHRSRLRVREIASELAGRDVRSFIKDDRFYRFRFHEFTDAHWAQLFEAYTQMPGWIPGNPRVDIARWFGVNESWPPFMWASVESFGLEVFGVLSADDWSAWEREFLAHTRGLPAMPGQAVIELGSVEEDMGRA